MGETGRPAPLQLSVVDDRFEITTAGDRRVRPPGRGAAASPLAGRQVIGRAPLAAGRWLTWVFYVRWSFDGDGIVQAWLDGEPVADDRGPNTHNDLIGPYMKAGAYAPDWLIDGPEDAIRERLVFIGSIGLAPEPYGAD
jgi:hypothetical protein